MSANDITTPTIAPAPEKLTKKALTADHPTWCPGCGDFAVLAAFYKVLERRQLPQESIVTLAGIGCSSRFPYFVNSHGRTSSTGVPSRWRPVSAWPAPTCTSFFSAATEMGSRSAAITLITAPARTSG